MTRPLLLLTLLALGAAAPALAQGGPRPPGPAGTLAQIEANRGCPLSVTTIAMGANRALAAGQQASQQSLATAATPGCRPLVSTQIAAGANLAVGRNSQAEQTLIAQGPRGALATTRFSRGANLALGARASATQRILNLTTP
jgi:hypothetical protein